MAAMIFLRQAIIRAVLLLSLAQVAYTITCLSCGEDGAESLSSCSSIIECEGGHTCYIEQYISVIHNFVPRYRAGCRDLHECNLIRCNTESFRNTSLSTKAPRNGRVGKRDDLVICSECCYNDTCNVKGCGANFTQTGSSGETLLQCFQCPKKRDDNGHCTEFAKCPSTSQHCAYKFHVGDDRIPFYELLCLEEKYCELLRNLSLTQHLKLDTQCCDQHLCNQSPYKTFNTSQAVEQYLKCPTDLVQTRATTTPVPTTTPTPTTTTTTKATTTTTTPKPTTTTTTPKPTTTTTTPKPTTTTTTSKPTTTTTTPKPTTTTTTPKPTTTTTTPKPTTTTTTPKPTTTTTTPKPTTTTTTPKPTTTTTTPKPTTTTTTPKPTTTTTTPKPTTTTTTPKPTTTTTTPKPRTTTTTPKPTTTTTTPKPTTTTTKPTTTTTTPKPTTTTTTPKPTTTTTTPKPTTTTTTPKPTTTTTTLKPTTTTTTPKPTTTTTTPKPTTTTTTPKPTTTSKATTTTTKATTTTTKATTTTTKATTVITTQQSTVSPSAPNTSTPPLPNTKSTTTTKPTPAASTKSIKCQVCAGPPVICESVHREATCTYPNNYCINKLTNHNTGKRQVVRQCGNAETCIRDWYHGTSDTDRCTKFDPNFIKTLDFECTFCCTKDNCNLPVVPDPTTWY